jgi:capsular exopolysaccharide synthesis family protein
MDLRNTLRFLKRRSRLIIIITLWCALIAFGIAFMIKPVYQAEVLVMKDTNKADMSNIGEVMQAFGADYTAALRSQIDIITSRPVTDRVIDKLKLLEDPEFSPSGSQLATILAKIPGLAQFSRPEPEADPVIGAIHKRTAIADAIAGKLKVTNDGRSMSIRISFESTDAKKAALIANTVAEEYLVDQLEAKYESTARVNKWLDDRLETLKQKLEVSEKAVGEFREKAKLIEVKDGSTLSANQMQAVNAQLVDARAATSQAQARLSSMEAMIHSKQGIDGAADVLASPLIQRLQEQESMVRRNTAELASKYGELHPKMVNARAELEGIQKKIREEVLNVVQSLSNEVSIARAKENQLKSELDKLELQAGVESKDSVTLRQLQRESDANRTLYENLLGRFKQTGEQEAMHIADSRIIARAEPPLKPSFPRKSLFAAIGMVIGCMLGISAGYLIEYFEPGFKTAAQLEEEVGLSVIGLLPIPPTIKKQTVQDYVLDKPFSSYSEVLRSVRTAIHFSNVDHPHKTLMVTSALPSEGKTSFCLSLARVLAKAGNRILLIDADMRRPRIASAIGLENVQNSLAHLLIGDKKFAQVVYNDPMMPTLDVIPTLHAPNPQDLLGSERMREVLAEVSERYDLVIIDTPPMLAVSDAAIMGHAVDTTILIVRWATTPRETVLRTCKLLRNFGCKFTGAVLSQVNTEQHAKYGESHFQHKYDEYYAN